MRATDWPPLGPGLRAPAGGPPPRSGARGTIILVGIVVMARSKDRWDIVIIGVREALWCSAVRARSKGRGNIVIIVIREALMCSAGRALSKERWDRVIILLREAL